jgi:chorismate mutase
LQISSPSKAMKAVAKDVGAGFISGLTGSRDKIKAVSKDLASDVRAAFSGRRESGLIRMINRDTAKLLSLASKRDSVAKKIADANKFASDTAGRARATGSLASIVSDDHYSPRYVEGRMKASLNSIKSFTANVTKLQKKGLNKNLLRQILEMGPEAGGAFAASLAGADAATIKRYNKLQADIDKQSAKLGKVGADMLYDSGKKAGAGFLTGLKAQQKDIEALMLSIAKGMQKSIKKALGIKSPSRVMEAVGRMTVLGLHGGIVRSVPVVRSAMHRVAHAVASGVPTALPAIAGPAVSAPAVGERRSQRAAAPSVTVVNNIYLENHGAIGSRMQMQDWLAQSLDDLSRTNRLPRSLRGAT